MNRPRSWIWLVVALSLPLAGSARAEGLDRLLPMGYPPLTNEERVITAVPFAPGSPAVVLLDARQDHWLRRGAADVHRIIRARRVKVLTAEGVERCRRFELKYEQNVRGEEFRARTILPDGSIVDGKKGIVRSSTQTGRQIVQVEFPKVQPGAILDLFVSVVADVSGEFGVDPWPAAQDLPVLESRYVFVPPMGLLFEARGRGLTEAELSQVQVTLGNEKPKLLAGQTDLRTPISFGDSQLLATPHSEWPGDFRLDPGNVAHVWTFRDVPPQARIPFAPDDLSGAGSVLYVIPKSFTTPNLGYEIAPDWPTWTGRMTDAWDRWMNQGTAELKQLAHEATAGSATPQDKAEAIRRTLRARIRLDRNWSASSAGSPHQVLQNGHGTSADIAAIAVVLLRESGVPAHLALVRNREDGLPPASVPVPSLYNDMLVRIDGEPPVFWSPASDAPFGALPIGLCGAIAVPLAGKIDGPVATPWQMPGGNKIVRLTKGELSSTGMIKADTTLMLSGPSAIDWRTRLHGMGAKEQREAAQRLLAGTVPDAVVSKVTVENLDSPDKELRVAFNWSAEKFASLHDGKLELPPVLIDPAHAADWTAENRSVDLNLGLPGDVRDSFELSLPKNMDDIIAPDPVHIEQPGLGLFDGSCDDWSENFVVHRRLQLNAGNFGVAYYPQIRDFFRLVAGFDEKRVQVLLK